MEKIASILFFFALLQGCVLQPTVLEFKPFHEKKFSPRKEKASLTTKQSMRLISQGYVLLGYIDLRQNLTTCFPGSECEEVRNDFYDDDDDFATEKLSTYPTDEELVYQAAIVGGDKVSLLQEKDIQDTITRQVCTHMTPFFYTIEGKTYTSYICGGYQTIYGILNAKIKRALVWRYEPELATSKENIDALKQALEVIVRKVEPQAEKTGETDPDGLFD